MKVSVKTTQLLEASVLGTLAFKNGIKRVPALDKELYKFFNGAIGETYTKITMPPILIV